MDMYQKRKMRQEKKNNQQNNGFDKIQLNWYITCYDKLLTNPYK